MLRWAAVLLAGIAAPALAHEDVRYGDAPEWVLPAPAFAQPERQQGAFALLYRDTQVLRDDAGTHVFEAWRTRIQTAEALALGSIGLVWNPAAGGPTVHGLKVIRDGEAIDVLESARFATFQREGALEQSMIDGLLTAHLQIPGLRVGDEVEFAATTTALDPTVPEHAFGIVALPHLPSPGTYRMRVRWEDGRTLAWSATPDIADDVRVQGNEALVVLERPGLFEPPSGAPTRFHAARLLDFSDFADWQQVSRRFHPLYAEAAALSPQSELRAEAAAIARRHATPAERAAAALRLVQDQIRYVYVGMNGANLTPASAEETWQRRYGDCKGKSALLLALLAELGIEAEPVLANLSSDDGINERLPSPALFDHVLVRARVDGRTYWMDGTRQGDSRLVDAPPEPFRFVLPLSGTGAALERLPFRPPAEPALLTLNAIDASAGIDQPVRYELTQILRGTDALQMRAALQALPEGSDEAALRQLFGGDTAWLELEQVGWRFVEGRGALVLTAIGTQEWEWGAADDEAITQIDIPKAGFYPPPERKRTGAQDAAAPWANDPKWFDCHVTTIKLPQAGKDRSWEHDVDAMNRQLGGTAFWRMADLRGDEVHTIMARRTVEAEIDAEEASAVNASIADFDNAISRVALRRTSVDGPQLAVDAQGIAEVPSVTGRDWLGDSSACMAPQ